MIRFATACLAVGVMGCAIFQRGPTDAEVRAGLEAQAQRLANDLVDGRTADFAAHFTPDGEMLVNGVMGPDGTIDVDLKGPDQIQSFLGQAGVPTDFSLQVSQFSRSGKEAHQVGNWLMQGQSGTFALDWRQGADGTWQITRGRFEGR